MITDNDKRELRCRMLGHEVNFSYCRCPGKDIPCRKIFDCWFETFDVKAFIEEHYTPEQIQQIMAPPQAKTASLMELIEKAKKNAGQ